MGSGCSKSGETPENHYFAGHSSDFDGKEDFFKEVQIKDDFSVIVTRRSFLKEHHYFAVGSKCPHYGANLAKGAMKDGRIYCPWHGACFDMESGDIEEFPGLDNIPTFKCLVKRDKGKSIYVVVEPIAMQDKVMRPLAKYTTNSLIFAIIGSGAAGYMCAQTLRQEGFVGRILMFTADKYLPYDRPKLTKEPGCTWENIKLRDKDFYDDNDIEVFLNSPVETLDTSDHVITIKGKHSREFTYDSVFIATGNRPRTYSNKIEGSNLKNILYIYNLEQSQTLAQLAVKKRLVILGSAFIAMELASSLKDKCSSITIISRSEVPYSFILGTTPGKRLLVHLLTNAKNIKFYPCDEVRSFKGNGKGEVTSVVTKRGKVLECDLVVGAIGAIPSTEFLDTKKFHFHKETKAIIVDHHLETNLPYVYAGGDCVSFPINVGAKEKVTIGHWQIALTHGRVAALNMLGNKLSIKDVVPYFWTTLCDLNIQYCGYGEGYDEILVFGSMADMEFCCLYRRDGRVLAAMGVNCDPIITKMAIELQTDTMKWEKEYPGFLVERFPEPPETVDSNAGRWKEINQKSFARHKLASQKIFFVKKFKDQVKTDDLETKIKWVVPPPRYYPDPVPEYNDWLDYATQAEEYDNKFEDKIFEALARHKVDQMKLNLAVNLAIKTKNQDLKPVNELLEKQYFEKVEDIFKSLPKVPKRKKIYQPWQSPYFYREIDLNKRREKMKLKRKKRIDMNKLAAKLAKANAWKEIESRARKLDYSELLARDKEFEERMASRK